MWRNWLARTASSMCIVLAIVSGAVGTTPAMADTAPSPSPTSSYSPVQPCRLLDTRTTPGSRLTAGRSIAVRVTGRCAVPAGSSAVAISVTAVDTGAAGFVTVWSSDQPQPVASTITWSRSGDTRANGTIVRLAPDGTISLFSSAATDIVVDVSGVFQATTTARAGRFVAMTPARLLDTRTTTRPVAAAAVTVALPTGVPADAMALAVSITTTETSGPGFFSAYPAGTTRPNASVLNTTAAGQTVAATAIVPVGAQGLQVFTQNGDHVIVDVFGYFTGTSAPVSADGLFVPATPTRVLDTRTSTAPLYTNGSIAVPFTSVTSITGGPVAAIVANWTATQSRGSGFVTAFPTATAKPFVSNLNYVAGDSVANMGIVAASAQGVSVYANRTVDLVVDLTGWFTGSPLPATGGAPDSNVAPTTPELPGCPTTGRAAVADKAAQRFWLCQDGYPATDALPMTTGGLAYGLPPVGTYHVFAKLAQNAGIHGERLYRFIAFYTTPRGNRIAFHEVVHQTPESVGDLALRGASSGCFRLRREDSIHVWDFLQQGDPVIILTA